MNKEKIILKEEGIYFIDIGKYSIVELEVMQIGFILQHRFFSFGEEGR